MDILLLFRALFKNKWLLLGLTLISSLLSFVITFRYEDVYKSTAQISTGFTVVEQVSLTNERFNFFEVDVKFNNLIESINSPKVFNLLSYKLLLHDLELTPPYRDKKETELNEIAFTESNLLNIKSLTKEKLDSMKVLNTYIESDRNIQELLIFYEYDYESLRKSINVKRIPGTDFISIESYTESPELSAFMVNTLVEVFLRYNSTSRFALSFESAEAFSNLVVQKRNEMEEKAEELRLFKSSNRVINFAIESTGAIDQLNKLETEKAEENRKARGLIFEIEDLNRRIIDFESISTSASGSNEEIINLRRRINSMNQRYISSGSTNKVLLDSILTFRSRLQNLLSRSGVSNNKEELINQKREKEVQLQIARDNLNSIETNIRSYRGNIGGFASKEAKISSLERELNMATAEYQSAQEKYKIALDLSLSSGNSIRQILYGQPAIEKEPSKRLIITALAGMSTFLIGSIVIILLEYLDISIKSASNFKDRTGYSPKAIINYVNLKKFSLYNQEVKSPIERKFQECIRKLRFEIETCGKRIFLITSAKQGEGKTTILHSLAISLGICNKKVLIVDFNFSNNSITKLFKAMPMLEKFPHKNKSCEELISKTMVDSINVIGSKGGSYSPSEILDLRLFREALLKELNNYDYIFIEGAALNEYSNSLELVSVVDSIVLILSAESVFRKTDDEVLNNLFSLKDKFLGVVLNKVGIDLINE